MSIKDGGPAFPIIPPIDKDGYSASGYPYPSDGISKRDWFAGIALPWCLQEFAGNAEDQRQPAEAAYQIADAMLEAGKVTK